MISVILLCGSFAGAATPPVLQAEIDRLMRIPAKLTFVEAREILKSLDQPLGIQYVAWTPEIDTRVVQKPFFRFEGSQANGTGSYEPGHDFGTFAVNAWTGDVWMNVGHGCGQAELVRWSGANQIALRQIRRLTKREKDNWPALQAFRPDCPEDEGRDYEPPPIEEILNLQPNFSLEEAMKLIKTIDRPFYLKGSVVEYRGGEEPEEVKAHVPFYIFVVSNDLANLGFNPVQVNPWTGDVWIMSGTRCHKSNHPWWPGLETFQAALRARIGPEQRRVFDTQRLLTPACGDPKDQDYHATPWLRDDIF